MKKAILALLASTLTTAVLFAASGDVTAPIRQFVNAFNSGDVKSAYAACATGNVVIVDEFPPYRWTGPKAPQNWVADYNKHALATGVTDGNVKYGAPTRSEIEGDLAYVIIPTVYTYKEHGQPMAEEGQLTFVLRLQTANWRISSWVWSGVKPHPAK